MDPRRPSTPAWSVVAVWFISAMLFSLVISSKTGHHIVLKPLLIRIPAAVFFYALLFARKNPLPLVLYCLAFVPPYLAMMSKTGVFSRLVKPGKHIASSK